MDDDLKTRLDAIADTVNRFKSEAVQLRVVEALLASLKGAQIGTTKPEPHVKRPRRSVKRKATADAASAGKPTKKRQTTRTSSSPGASAAINDLLANGFFKKPQTIAAVIAHCGTQRGHHYKANECSTPLLRLLRDEKLTRAKNSDGQYEYLAS